MSEDFLSQEEVDALLKGVAGDIDESEGPYDGHGVRPYNLATQERIVRGRMPALENINERFAQLFGAGLYNFMRRNAEIAVGPVRTIKYSEFLRNLALPSNLNLVQVKPLRGTALFIFDPNLVFLVVDSMFGGNGQLQADTESRDFTPTERHIIQRLLALAFDSLEQSWAAVHQIKFEYLRSEMNAQFAGIAMPNDIVVATTFTITLGQTGGLFHVCMPYTMLEPLRDLLQSNLPGDRASGDKRWGRMLSKQVQGAEVELVLNLGHARLTIEQLLGMEIGDVIAVEVPQPILAEVDGVPVMECKCGVLNGQYAIRVEKLMSSATQED